eukprot:Gb_29716 [translate_table: standard]
MERAEGNMNIYKVCRKIKRMDQSLYNALRSIYEDSLFVAEIRRLWPDLPLIANLRCGLWYSSHFDATCYFKSTDGHTGNWSFNPTRLNMHVASLAAEKGGCIIVDATRKGKRFPDSMSKTIPIWTCVLNRSIKDFRSSKPMRSSEDSGTSLKLLSSENAISQGEEKLELQFDCQLQGMKSADSNSEIFCNKRIMVNSSDEEWDCSLHLPLWVSETEKANIDGRIQGWTEILEATGTDISSISASLKRPLCPLWISQKTVIWLNEVPDLDSWNFTPIILVSASCSALTTHRVSDSEFSWSYIPGAADDEESWARGLSPNLFWKHAYDLITGGPCVCNRMVADIVEKDRVYRSQRGQNTSQIRVKPKKISAEYNDLLEEGCVSECQYDIDIGCRFSLVERTEKMGEQRIEQLPESHINLYWIGATKLAIGTNQYGQAGATSDQVDCIINCDIASVFMPCAGEDAYFHLPILTSKFDRYALQNNLPSAIAFARKKLERGKTLLVCCSNGEDVSVCVCLAILMSLFDDEGVFDNGRSKNVMVSKWDVRRRLVYICSFASKARPSRGNLKQVFNFLIKENVDSCN